MASLKDKSNSILTEKQNKIIPENIKSGVQIFGVTGNCSGVNADDVYDDGVGVGANSMRFEEMMNMFEMNLRISGGLTSGSSVLLVGSKENQDSPNNIVKVGCQLAPDQYNEYGLIPENIKKDVTIFGVTGNYEGGTSGKYAPTHISFAGYNNSDDTALKKEISELDFSKITNARYMFANMSNLSSLDLRSLDTSSFTNMEYMFECNLSLTTIDLSNFKTNNVTNMSYMFQNVQSISTLDLSSFDTSSVGIMSYMFAMCMNLTTLDLSSFNTSGVGDMQGMFEQCSHLSTLDLSSFDTSNVRYMSYMFNGDTSLTTLDLSNFIINSQCNLYSMFGGCSNLSTLDISGMDITDTNDTNEMFTGVPADCTIYVKNQTMKDKILAIRNDLTNVQIKTA